jgi:exodeoxyribonuclease III
LAIRRIKENMKLVSWNVNGIRACVKKGFLDYFKDVDADIFCLQETKLQEGQISLELEGYHQYWNYALKKGYSGTAIFTKEKPLSVKYGVGELDEEPEGRIITLEFEKFYMVNVYTPNAKRDLSRLNYRLEWEDEMINYLKELDLLKPVIFCGDLNVAHSELDLKNPKTNIGNSGFTYEERGKMTELLDAGFIDTFRHFYPDREGAYSWWSYMAKVRERNIGWRIDYFIVSKRMADSLIEANIHCDVMGSDHCPVVLETNL